MPFPTCELTEKRYFEKLENDLNEGLYDLFIRHLDEAEGKIQSKEALILTIRTAIDRIRSITKPENQREYNRYSLILCNRSLRLNKRDEDIKTIKKRILEDYTQSDKENEEPHIPLDYQVTELRLTYDISYIKYLLRTYMEGNQSWMTLANAIYLLRAAKLIEIDDPELEKWEKELLPKVEKRDLIEKYFDNPKGTVLILDANFIIQRTMQGTNEFDLEKAGNDNKIIITPSVKQELELYLEGLRPRFNTIKNYYPGFRDLGSFNKVKAKIEKYIVKYQRNGISPSSEEEENIRIFYSSFLPQLMEIAQEKIKFSRLTLSQRLRKLAKRPDFLPEKGDLRLLAEAVRLARDEKIGIVTEDRDFLAFGGMIHERFGVRVYKS